jgi:indole-3-glycerol phosphate synthase
MSGEGDILSRIVAQRRRRLGETPAFDPARQEVGAVAPPGPAFLEALRTRRGRAVIAEIKLGSPRLGSLVDRLDPEAQAALYARHGASALSVVVEPDFFFGSYELLTRCRAASGLPALAKDFVTDARQLDWAWRAGASAVLLVARLVPVVDLNELAERAEDLGMVPFVECHSAADVAKLAGRSWPIVGINNRDLRSFRVSLQHSIDLLERLPGRALKVAESGIESGAQVARLAGAGFDAFLVGESLLLADDPAAKLRELIAAPDGAP